MSFCHKIILSNIYDKIHNSDIFYIKDDILLKIHLMEDLIHDYLYNII